MVKSEVGVAISVTVQLALFSACSTWRSTRMSVPRICTSVSPFPAAVPTATSLNCRVCSPSFSPVWVVSLTWSFPCSVSLVEVLVVDDLSSASGDGAAKLEMCERRVEYANTLPVISRESTTIDANACAVLFATFIFSSVVYSFSKKITPDFQEPPAAWNSRAQIHPHRRNSTFMVAGTIAQTVPDGQGGQDGNFRRSRRKEPKEDNLLPSQRPTESLF